MRLSLSRSHRDEPVLRNPRRRRAPRAFTQEISRYVFERGLDAGGKRLAGVRYLSRLGDEFENWAIFEGSEPANTTSGPIATDDEDLAAALEKLDPQLAD